MSFLRLKKYAVNIYMGFPMRILIHNPVRSVRVCLTLTIRYSEKDLIAPIADSRKERKQRTALRRAYIR